MSTYYKDKPIPKIPEDILATAKGIVYKITNSVNDKIYIGQTLSHYYRMEGRWIMTGIKDRWRRHLSNLKDNESQFYTDIKEFGEEKFSISIYKTVPIEEIHTLNMEEFNAINELDTAEPNGYNKIKWVNSTCFTKYVFMLHFNLLNDIPSMNKNTTSKDRAQQKCVSQSNVLDFYSDKEIEKVDMRIINSHGNPDQVRLVVKLKNQRDLHRTSWYIKDEPSKLLKYVMRVAEALIETPFIDPKAKSIIDKNSVAIDVYKYQTRLDEASKFKFKNVSGMVTEYRDRGIMTYLLILSGDGSKNIRYSFGGKTIDIKDAYNQAEEFVNKLKELTTIQNINLRDINQRKTNFAELIFID